MYCLYASIHATNVHKGNNENIKEKQINWAKMHNITQ